MGNQFEYFAKNPDYPVLLLEDEMIDEMIEQGSIIGDIEAGLWRVLEVRKGGSSC